MDIIKEIMSTCDEMFEKTKSLLFLYTFLYLHALRKHTKTSEIIHLGLHLPVYKYRYSYKMSISHNKYIQAYIILILKNFVKY